MTTYQDNPYYYVDSPLNHPDEELWWAGPVYAERGADPMAAV